MNTIKNTVNLIGRLGNDPVIKTFGEKGKKATFSIATKESYKNNSGQWVNQTHWYQLVAWGSLATLSEKLLKKGNEIAIEGRLANENYTNAEGVKKNKTEIILREFVQLSKTEVKK